MRRRAQARLRMRKEKKEGRARPIMYFPFVLLLFVLGASFFVRIKLITHTSRISAISFTQRLSGAIGPIYRGGVPASMAAALRKIIARKPAKFTQHKVLPGYVPIGIHHPKPSLPSSENGKPSNAVPGGFHSSLDECAPKICPWPKQFAVPQPPFTMPKCLVRSHFEKILRALVSPNSVSGLLNLKVLLASKWSVHPNQSHRFLVVNYHMAHGVAWMDCRDSTL